MTIFENVVSLHRCLKLNKTTTITTIIIVTTKTKREMNATKKEELTIIKIGDFDYNYMNKEGINDWFKFVSYFIKDGFAKIQRSDSLYNLIDKKGNFISNEWFKLIGDFDEGGLALIQRGDGLWNFIDKHGKLLSNEWFSWVDDFRDGFARVKRTNGEQAKIDKNGKIVSK